VNANDALVHIDATSSCLRGDIALLWVVAMVIVVVVDVVDVVVVVVVVVVVDIVVVSEIQQREYDSCLCADLFAINFPRN
jgi:hypothetical protein